MEQTVPLLATLLALSRPEDDYPPLALTPDLKDSADHLALVQQTGNRQVFAKSLIDLGFVHQWHGKLTEADRACEEALLISRQEGYQVTSHDFR